MDKIVSWQKIEFEEDDLLNEDLSEEVQEEFEESGKIILSPGSFGDRYQTILGMVDGNEFSVVKVFDLFLLRSNFNLTVDLLTKIKLSDGVEILQAVSRYLCIIGLGKLFDQQIVKAKIENILTGKHEHYLMCCDLPEEVKISAVNIYNKIKKFPFWLIFIYPNGEIIKFTTTDKEDFSIQLLKYEQAKAETQGFLLNSQG